MNPHLSRHDSLNTSMIDATPPCPIMIYEIKIDNLFVVNQLCLLEAGSEIRLYRNWWTTMDQQWNNIGAGEQRCSSTWSWFQCREYCTVWNQRNTDIPDTHRIISFLMVDVTSPCPIMIYEIEIDELLIADMLCLLEAGSEIRLYRSWWLQRWINN